MATRFYLEATGTAPVSSTNWNATAFNNTTAWSPVNLPMNNFKGSSTRTNTTFASVAGGFAYAGFQFTSVQTLAAQTITGTHSAIFKVFGISLNDNYAYALRVVSNDGSTVRGTCKNSTAGTGLGTVWNTSTQQTSIMANAVANTSVTASAGDRIQLQIGGDTGAVTGSRKMQLGSSDATDYALTDGLTTDINPWIEFSQTLVFQTGANQLMMVGCGI